MSDKLRVLIFSSIFPNSLEGNKGIYIFHQAKELSRSCEVRVVAPIPYVPGVLRRHPKYSMVARVPELETIDGLSVSHPRVFLTPRFGHSLYGLFFFVSLILRIKRIKNVFKPDVLISYWVYPDGYASVWFGKILGIPVIVGGLGCDINEAEANPLRAAAVRWTLKNSSRVMAVSQAMKSTMAGLGAFTDKIRAIPNGISNDFVPLDKEHARSLVSLNLPSADTKVILYCGRLSPEKGVNYLLDAVSLLHEHGVAFHLLLVGEGPERQRLQDMVRVSGLERQIEFRGEVSHKEVPVLMNAADVFCLPSIREGWPNVLMESLACGTPVVASAVGGIPEIVINDNYGFLAPKQDAQALSAALEKAIVKEWDRDSIAASMRQRTWQTVAEEIVEEIKLVLN
ncbi:MAG TPA: glycosyltransferase family 4 protein [Syntrophorhabdaceae bacterium]|nr:glycosyltransferase family 4 protein [Syntrophorhabdaceae bacterium]